MVTLTGAGTAGVGDAGAPALPAPCLDYRSRSDTAVADGGAAAPRRGPGARVGGVRSRARVVNRARVFATGEVEVRTVLTGAAGRPPAPVHGVQRWSRGVSRRGRRVIRRAVAGHAAKYGRRAYLYTLTSESATVPDEVFADRMRTWLMWLRKYAPHAVRHYVWVRDLQARGVLHGHVILFERMPRDVWLRMRRLWADHYGMGPGSVDVKTVGAGRAAAYVTRYVTQHRDPEGYRVGRNGEPYVCEAFRGNAYGMSTAMRALSWHRTEFVLPWGSGPELGAVNLRGCVLFFASVDEAHDALGRALGGCYSAGGDGEGVRVPADGFVDRGCRDAARV